MNQDTEITQKSFSTTKEYTRGSFKSLINHYISQFKRKGGFNDID